MSTNFFGGSFFSGGFFGTTPAVDTGVNGAPWWEAENANKKKKRIEYTLNKEREDANNAAIILLMLKG